MIEPLIDSKSLSELRRILIAYPPLAEAFGVPVKFTVILDANIAIRDLLHQIRYPQRQTALQECIRSSVLRVCAPTWLDEEMTKSTIPKVARRRGYSEADLHTLWLEYRELIVWDNQYARDAFQVDGHVDQKDIPYVELEKRIQAVGILSGDKDIEQLGGHMLGLEFVLQTRGYARSKAYSVSIYVNGTICGSLGLAALTVIFQGIGSLIAKLPAWARATLLMAIVIAVLHPKSRQYILNGLANLTDTGISLLPHIRALIESAIQEHENAGQALLKTQQLITRQDGA